MFQLLKKVNCFLVKVQGASTANHLDDGAVDKCQGFSSNKAISLSSCSQTDECSRRFSGMQLNLHLAKYK